MVNIYSVVVSKEWKIRFNTNIEGLDNKVNWIRRSSKLIESLQPGEKCIVLLPNSAFTDVYSECAKITQLFPLISVLLIFDSEEEFDMKKSISSHASDVVFLSSPPTKILQVLNYAIENIGKKSIIEHSQAIKEVKVITIASTKGGVGKTTVAVNLAVVFAQKESKVAVIDLDLQFGDIALFIDVKPKRTIYDWVKEGKDNKKIESYMTPYKDGISILAAPQRPEFAEVITGDDVRTALMKLKQQFDVVIVDASSQLNENVLIALENSDDILMMTYMDLPTLKNSKILLDTLKSLQLSERTKIIVNREMKVTGMSVDTVEKVLGKNVFAVLPEEKAMITAVNEGVPVSSSNPKSTTAKKFDQMVEKLIDPDYEIAVMNKKTKLPSLLRRRL